MVLNEEAWTHFHGRSEELDELMTAWNQARKGNPQWVALAAESGNGKTRLVQELYRRISAQQEDGNAYWPAGLPIADKRLQINPEFSSAALAQIDHDGKLPWLWWGIRCQDPGAHNPSESTFAARSAFAQLEPHLMLLALRAAKGKTRIEAGKKIATSAANLLSMGWFDPMLNLFELGTSYRDFREHMLRAGCDVQTRKRELVSEFRTSLIDALFKFLEDQVPVVIVLDDTHWMDPETTRFLRDFVERLGARKLKLLIISTTWAKEWNTDSDGSARTEFEQFRKVQKGYSFEVGKIEAIHAKVFIGSLVPGLSEQDVATIVGNADGNFRYLSEVAVALSLRMEYFENNNPALGLSAQGRNNLLSGPIGLEELIARRFELLPQPVKAVLQYSSYQGVQFDPKLTELTYRAIGDGAPDPIAQVEALAYAEIPASMISSVESGLKEFLQAPYWRVIERISRRWDYPRIDQVYRATLRDLLAQNISHQMVNYLPMIGRLADLATEPEEKATWLEILVKACYANRTFESGLVYLAQLGRCYAQRDREHRWSFVSATPVDVRIAALEIISHFGYRLPPASPLDDETAESWGNQISGSLGLTLDQDIITEQDELRLQAIEAIQRFRQAFGHMHHLHRISSAVLEARLERLRADGDDTRRAAAIIASLQATETQAPVFLRNRDMETLWSRYPEIESMLAAMQDGNEKYALQSWFVISACIFGPPDFPGPEGALHAPNGRVLTALGYAVAPLRRLFAAMDPEAHYDQALQGAILRAGLLITETGCQYGAVVDQQWTESLWKIAYGISQQLEAQATSVELAYLALDTMLAIGMRAKFLTDRNIFAVDIFLATAVTIHEASNALRRHAGGRTDVVALCWRVELLMLEAQEGAGRTADEILYEAARLWPLLLQDVALTEDSKRAVFGEAVQIFPLAVLWYDSRLAGTEYGDLSWQQLAQAYDDLSPPRFNQLVSLVRSDR
jgi:hypothetical protein